MKVEDNPSRGVRVWLTSDELLKLTDVPPKGTKKWTAVNLLGRAGLKLNELLNIKREHVSAEDPQASLQVPGGGVKPRLRQTPIPEPVAYTILAYDSGPVFDITSRTVRRYVKRCGRKLAAQTGEEIWERVSPNDLRRSWADVLLTDGIPPELVMQWGGWDDPEMFQKMFLSRFNTDLSLEEASRSEIY